MAELPAGFEEVRPGDLDAARFRRTPEELGQAIGPKGAIPEGFESLSPADIPDQNIAEYATSLRHGVFNAAADTYGFLVDAVDFTRAFVEDQIGPVVLGKDARAPSGQGDRVRRNLRRVGAEVGLTSDPDAQVFNPYTERVGAGIFDVALGLAPLVGMTQKAATPVKNLYLSGAVNSFRRGPGTFVLKELTAGVTSGLTAQFAVEAMPGNPLADPTGAIGGPTGLALLTKPIGAALTFARKQLLPLTPLGAENRAGRLVVDELTSIGEDPAAILRHLADEDRQYFGIGETPPAIRTESKTLIGMERHSMSTSAHSRGQFSTTYDLLLKRLLLEMRETTTGGALTDATAAAKSRNQYLNALFDTSINNALEIAERTLVPFGVPAGLSSEGIASRMKDASIAYSDIFDSARLSAVAERDRVRALIPRTRGIATEPLKIEIRRIIDKSPRFLTSFPVKKELMKILLPEVRIEKLKGGKTRKLRGLPPGTVQHIETLENVINLKERMQVERRLEKNKPVSNRTVMDNIDKITGALDKHIQRYAEVNPDSAGAISNYLEIADAVDEKFFKGFAADLHATDLRDVRKIPPGSVLDETLAGRQDKVDNQLYSLQLALEDTRIFPPDPNTGKPRLSGAANTEVEKFIGLKFYLQSLDPDTKEISAKSIAQFRNENSRLLGLLPNVARRLETAETAKRFADEVAETAEALRFSKWDFIQARTAAFIGAPVKKAFAALWDNPTVKGESVLSIRNAVFKAKQDPARFADGSAKAHRGLQVGYMEELIGESQLFSALEGEASGLARFTLDQQGATSDLASFLGRFIANAEKTTAIRTKTGLFDTQNLENFNVLLGESRRLLGRIRSGATIDQLTGQASDSAFLDFWVRVAGSRFGAWAGGQRDALIRASAGSKFFRRVVEQFPIDSTRRVLASAPFDNELMSRMLAKGVQEKEEAFDQLRAYALGALPKSSFSEQEQKQIVVSDEEIQELFNRPEEQDRIRRKVEDLQKEAPARIRARRGNGQL